MIPVAEFFQVYLLAALGVGTVFYLMCVRNDKLDLKLTEPREALPVAIFCGIIWPLVLFWGAIILLSFLEKGRDRTGENPAHGSLEARIDRGEFKK